MSEKEGVIKYRLLHEPGSLPKTVDIRLLNAWRSLLFKLGLIGQCPKRYHGLGYGNISQRLNPKQPAFLISGTQTGHLPLLGPEHFAIVQTASPRENTILSNGPCQPSSEALTHAGVYLHRPECQAVIHVHCPEIWRQTMALKLPHTAADIAYGSVQMADAVACMFDAGDLDRLPLFSMLGHEDGIVAFGDSLAAAASTLLEQLAIALAIEQTVADG